MMILVYLTVSASLTSILSFVHHPISMGLILILCATLVGLFCLSFSVSWFFYLLVLVFLGGIMILIIYMSTMSSNEKFTRAGLGSALPQATLMFFTVLSTSAFHGECHVSSAPMSASSLLYENSQLSSLILMMVYLLIVLICVVKLVKFETGPLIKRL